MMETKTRNVGYIENSDTKKVAKQLTKFEKQLTNQLTIFQIQLLTNSLTNFFQLENSFS